MHISSFFAPGILAWAHLTARGQAHPNLAPRDCPPLTSPFHLTGVPKDGSATYPIRTARAALGAMTLSWSADPYQDLYTFNETEQRIYISDTTVGAAAAKLDAPVVFAQGDMWARNGRPYGDLGLYMLVIDDKCARYLVANDLTFVNGWEAKPSESDARLRPMWWYGDDRGNAAIRIGRPAA